MKPFEQQTYYELLEIPVTAPDAEILAAYQRALETYSPDSVAVYALVDPGQLDALRARLTEAMEILTEPDLREEYDRIIGVSRTGANTVVPPAPSLEESTQAKQSPAPATAAAAEPGAPAREASEAVALTLPAAPTPGEAPVAAAPQPAPAAEKVEAPAAPSPAPAPAAEKVETPAPAASAPAPAPAAEKVEAPAMAAPAAAPAPAAEKVEAPAAPSSAPASPETVAAPSAPAVAAAQEPVAPVPAALVAPAGVSPTQIHAAFRSYAISYVPVLVPAPSLTGSAFLSPFAVPAQPGAPLPMPEAPREEKAAQASPSPAAAPAPEAAVAPAPVPTAAPVPTPAAPSVAAPVEAAQSTPAAAAAPVAEAPQAAPAQAAPEPSRPAEPEPASKSPSSPPPAARPAAAHEEEEELSGARAPLPSQAATQPGATEAGARSPASRPERPLRPTPPPLPPGGRRPVRATPTPPPVAAAGQVGKSSARPASPASLNLDEAQQIAQESAIANAEAALAVVAAKAREPKPKPIELPPNTEFNGELLRRVRESRNLTLQQVAERTRISSKHLENVEADRYTALPATVYLRGMLMSLARELGLDPLRVSKSYLALATAPKKK